MTAGIQAWNQHASETEDFFAGLEGRSRLTPGYAELIEHPDLVAPNMGELLGLSGAAPIARHLASQRVDPAPFSSPTSDLSRPMVVQMPADWDQTSAAADTELARRLGYDLLSAWDG